MSSASAQPQIVPPRWSANASAMQQELRGLLHEQPGMDAKIPRQRPMAIQDPVRLVSNGEPIAALPFVGALIVRSSRHLGNHLVRRFHGEGVRSSSRGSTDCPRTQSRRPVQTQCSCLTVHVFARLLLHLAHALLHALPWETVR